ncbi:outer membrane protein TolC, putative [Parvularcula bermudensis HTCC2503]|uniref:Outer membrane protein TolC, putative n=1 Tax=Parvularcula bermudensis (strain ATCC BAA-594 / HTCC2503 / KCTC 12087) TaxID=314260 RepID=E0TFW1_PARBH|nr:TolC family protein [Parvularcula bermudensis]ADM09560.1 outer membrane protein TolC, putative [Parvularcula bermudensis HTCC2503]
MVGVKKPLICAAVMAITAVCPAVAQTLTASIDQAMQADPRIREAQSLMAAAEARLSGAQSGRMPLIRLRGQADYLSSETTSESDRVVAGVEIDEIFTTETDNERYQGAVDARLELYAGGRIRGEIASAKAAAEAARAEIRQVELEIYRDVADAYLETYVDQESFRLAEDSLSLSEQRLRRAQRQFDLGILTRTDVLQADARLAGARAALADARGDLAISRYRYIELVGQAPEDLSLPTLSPPANVDQQSVVSTALSDAPLVEVAEHLEAASSEAIRVARAQGRPNVALGATYEYTDGTSTLLDTREEFLVGVRVEVPLYSGGRVSALIREAEALNQRDQERLAQARRTIERTAFEAFERYRQSLVAVDFAEEVVEANEAVAEGVRVESENGIRTTLDLLNAERNLLDARTNLLEAQKEATLATIDVLLVLDCMPGRDISCAVGDVVMFEDPAPDGADTTAAL